jgi:acyl-CoA thioester hydrolase
VRLSIDPSTSTADYDFVHQIRVRFVETDAMGIVHHSNYLAYFEEARVEYLRHVGHPFTEWRDDGLESPVLESYLRYRQPLHFDDLVDVRLRLAAVTRTTFQMAYLLTVHDPDGDVGVRATGVTVHGCVTTEGRPTRLPAWLVELGAASTR